MPHHGRSRSVLGNVEEEDRGVAFREVFPRMVIRSVRGRVVGER